tara:strand:- start:3152 stop:3745 length:594 start_codon:yes stop_codon:yes gene_type:complete
MTSKILYVLLLFLSLQGFSQNVKLKKAFNGKDLKGWVIPDGNLWWTVNNKILEANSDPTKKGTILWTEKSYTNFVVELDFLMGEGRVDSGVFLRTEKQQIQIGESGSLKRDMTGSPYIPGKGYPVEAERMKEILKLKDWNTIKIKANGGEYTVWMNGEEVMNYDSDTVIENGPIGLQLHPGRDMHISFRNIKIGKLK